MGCLGDDLWVRVLQLGVEGGALDYRDLCSLSFVCRSLRRLSGLDRLWQIVWLKDFPAPLEQAEQPPKLTKGKEKNAPSWKYFYRTRFERVRAVKMAAHRRRVMRVESRMALLQADIQYMHRLIGKERHNLYDTLAERGTLEHARQAAVALQVWQPQVVRSRLEQVLEQQPINLAAHRQSLEMEVRVCRERIQRFEKSLKEKIHLMERTKQELNALTFNPAHEPPWHVECPTESERASKKA